MMARYSEHVSVRVRVRAYVCASVCASVCACVRAYVRTRLTVAVVFFALVRQPARYYLRWNKEHDEVVKVYSGLPTSQAPLSVFILACA